MSGTFQETEIGPIPQNWRLATGEEITSLITKGASPRWQGFAYGNSGMLFVTSENVRDGFLDISKPKFLPLEFHEKIARSAIRKGDMLVNLVGASIGRSCLIRRELGVANINQAVAVFRPNTLVDPDFVSFAFQHPETIQRILGMQVEAARPNISLGDLRAFKLALPPLPEQQAIAAALSDADAVVAGLERVIAKKRLIKQGAMQDLLTARRRLPGFSGKWEEATISDVAHVDPEALGAGTPKDYAFRYISLEDVNQGVLSGWTDVAFGSAPSRARRILQKDDVLLGTVRPNLKSHMLFDRLGADWVGSTGFAVLRPRPEKCIPGYLFELIMSDVIGRQIDEVIAGSNYPAISNSDVRKLKVFLPSIDEQKAIAAVLRDMDAEIQTLESRLAKARAVKEGMMQNLLTGRVRLV